MAGLKRIAVCVRGQVQGVFFRRESQQKARRLGLSGFARNEADGSVYAEAEGSETALGDFIRWCRTGPANARVEAVESKEIPLRGEEEFEVIH